MCACNQLDLISPTHALRLLPINAVYLLILQKKNLQIKIFLYKKYIFFISKIRKSEIWHIAYQKLQYSHSEIWMLFLANPKLLKDFLIDRWGGITVFSQGPSFLVWCDLGLMEDWPPWCLPPSSSRQGAGADWQNSMGASAAVPTAPPRSTWCF